MSRLLGLLVLLPLVGALLCALLPASWAARVAGATAAALATVHGRDARRAHLRLTGLVVLVAAITHTGPLTR